VRFDVTTHASPEQVLRALTDFTDRRLQIWSRTLDPKRYEVRGQGDSWAVARESSPGSPFWVVVRYDWSDPTVVRWTVEESSYGGHGTGAVRIAPTDEGGSRLHVDWDYTDISRTRDKVILFLIQRFPMSRLISRMWVSALDRYAQTDPD
jgi:Polyketide cyclase / dehydrase and lipid transport